MATIKIKPIPPSLFIFFSTNISSMKSTSEGYSMLCSSHMNIHAFSYFAYFSFPFKDPNPVEKKKKRKEIVIWGEPVPKSLEKGGYKSAVTTFECLNRAFLCSYLYQLLFDRLNQNPFQKSKESKDLIATVAHFTSFISGTCQWWLLKWLLNLWKLKNVFNLPPPLLFSLG